MAPLSLPLSLSPSLPLSLSHSPPPLLKVSTGMGQVIVNWLFTAQVALSKLLIALRSSGRLSAASNQSVVSYWAASNGLLISLSRIKYVLGSIDRNSGQREANIQQS